MEQTGFSSTDLAKVLGIIKSRVEDLRSGLDCGDDLINQGASLLRVTPCWLRGHAVVLPDDLAEKLVDLADKGRPFSDDALTISRVAASWSLCPECSVDAGSGVITRP